MASACIGPRAGHIHGIDEYVEISSMLEVSKIVALTILEWCGQEQ
jgi:acetylornithine deacetylase/succinyl-diaminopimelate desuccinylase-like protein